MRPVIAYTASRFLLFAATAAILLLIGVTGLLNLALSVLISGIVSYVVLSKQRDAVSTAVVERTQRQGHGHGEGDGGAAPSAE
ncbi:DUF4229 domain-containing protein [Actinocorallia sp. A-T 12471]|uniref:DUF4229 domain-containing protein n=1 Tax=Actinocorallia sp. A-T 12471 TaxID=3089813 RepID=UPI0029D06DB5|nr:DUF4229 domain-containing protein [Actinocorallia sp. A-T 12471]MDX6741747.1 DUF4229 domain-containing protein [Actinocorallia sp. A-T 12471]